MRNFIIPILIATTLVLNGCQALSEPSSEQPAGSAPPFIQYDYLYDCLWRVADAAEESGAIPPLLADAKSALCFEQGSGEVLMLRRRADMAEESEETYTIVQEGVYSIERESGTVSILSGETNYYFRIERLNDRTMTLYYRGDPNCYVAYTRCGFESVAGVE